MNKIRAVDPQAPDATLVRETVHRLQQGGMVVLPTRHLYGLGVDALNPSAVARVFATKRRPHDRPLLILVASRKALSRYARSVDARAALLMDAFWPGKLTIVIEARSTLPDALTGGTGRIGIRVPDHPVCRALLQEMDGALTATSANLSGQPGCRRIEDLPPEVAAAADLILDAGPLLPGIGSTVVDVRPEGVTVLREGAVRLAAIHQVLVGAGEAPPLGAPIQTQADG